MKLAWSMPLKFASFDNPQLHLLRTQESGVPLYSAAKHRTGSFLRDHFALEDSQSETVNGSQRLSGQKHDLICVVNSGCAGV